MKKTIVIVLMLALCFNSLGYYIMHNYLKYQIRKEIKARIKKSVPPDELITLILTQTNSNDFKWIHEKEFRYEGTMYDVVTKEEYANGTTVLNCITDKQETVLFKNLGRYVCNTMNSDPKNARAGTLLFNFLSGLYPPVNYEFQPLISEQELLSTCYSFSFSVPDLPVMYPPPKV